MFTANPITGTRDEVVVDAAWGLGEAVVGGLVTPDHIVADKATGAIKQVTIGDKAVMTVPTATGTEERAVELERRNAQVLNAAQVAELVRLGATIEALYGEPQDIEWCAAGSTLHCPSPTHHNPTSRTCEMGKPGRRRKVDQGLQAAGMGY